MSSSNLVLITGVTGHVGFRVLLDALKAGYSVRGAVRSEAAARVQKIKSSPEIAALKLAPNTLTFVTVPDFLAPGAFDEAVKGVKYIIHVASPIPVGRVGQGDEDAVFIEPAKRGTLAVLEAAEKTSTVEKVVITSSNMANFNVSIFGTGTDKMITPQDREPFVPSPYGHPFAAYGYSKIAALKAGEDFYNQKKPKFSIVHILPAMVFGADPLVDSAEDMTKFGTNQMLLAAVTGSGDPRPSGTAHVADVAKVHVAALNPAIKGLQAYGVCADVDWPKLGSTLEKLYPQEVKAGTFKAAPELAGTQIPYDVSATEKTFGFKHLGLEDQVKETLDLYLKLKA